LFGAPGRLRLVWLSGASGGEGDGVFERSSYFDIKARSVLVRAEGSPWIAKLDKWGRLACANTDKCKGMKSRHRVHGRQPLHLGPVSRRRRLHQPQCCINPNIDNGVYCGVGKICNNGACVVK